jgi:hypothetical protein
MWIVYLLFVLAIILIPENAYAWGPGMHLETALITLERIREVAPAIAAIITEHPRHFIYGTVSPDILVGKRYAGYHWHCHNWNVAKVLLDSATTTAEKSGVYGYLCHLAADTVAHNYYVPYKTVRGYSARLLSHAYWELRYDLNVNPRVWKEVDHIMEGDYDDFDALMEKILRKTILSFRTSRIIFRGILKLEQLQHIRSTLHIFAQKSKWKILPDRFGHFYNLTVGTVMDFLKDPAKARCLKADPAGTARLPEALQLRNRIRENLQRGVITRHQADQWVKLCERRLEGSLFLPVMWWPDVYDVV